MVRLNFFTLFRLELGIRSIEIEIDEQIKLKELLYLAEKKSGKNFVYKLIEDGKLSESAIVLVNGKNVHHLQKLDTVIKDGDEIALFPPGGGG